MDDGADKFKHVMTKAAGGAIKGAMWGFIAAAAITALSVGLALFTGGASLLGLLFTPATATIVTYAALGGAALGGLEGISTANSVTEEKITLQKKEIAQGNMLAALQERQQTINAGMAPKSVVAPGMIPQQQQGHGMQMS